MLIVLSVAAAAALIVVAYSKVQEHEPETATAGLRAVRDLADVVIVCARAIEGVVDVLSRPTRLAHVDDRGWNISRNHETDYEVEEDDEHL